jgi:fumarate reductase subunit D
VGQLQRAEAWAQSFAGTRLTGVIAAVAIPILGVAIAFTMFANSDRRGWNVLGLAAIGVFLWLIVVLAASSS